MGDNTQYLQEDDQRKYVAKITFAADSAPGPVKAVGHDHHDPGQNDEHDNRIIEKRWHAG